MNLNEECQLIDFYKFLIECSVDLLFVQFDDFSFKVFTLKTGATVICMQMAKSLNRIFYEEE